MAGTGIGGVLATVSETTVQVQSERQFRTLRDLAGCAAKAKSEKDACENAAASLASNGADVPFALFYLLDGDGQPTWAGSAGFGEGKGDVPAPWPLAAAIAQRQVEVIDLPAARFGALPAGPWAEPPPRRIRSALMA